MELKTIRIQRVVEQQNLAHSVGGHRRRRESRRYHHADGGGTGHRRYAADLRDAGRRTRDCRRAVRPPCAVGRGTFDRNARQTG